MGIQRSEGNSSTEISLFAGSNRHSTFEMLLCKTEVDNEDMLVVSREYKIGLIIFSS